MTRAPTEMELRVIDAMGAEPPRAANEAPRDFLLRLVRVVIRAMREPTADMLACGHNAGWHGGIEDYKPAEEEAAQDLWQKMIDVASPPLPEPQPWGDERRSGADRRGPWVFKHDGKRRLPKGRRRCDGGRAWT